MAKVCITDREVSRELLPPVCMQCGARATVWRDRNFSWAPSWVLIFIFCGLLPLLIVWLITTKRMRVTLPFCDEHANHFSWRQRFVAVALLGVVCLAIGTGVAVTHLEGDLQGAIGLIGAVLAFGLLVAAAIVSQSGIRPSEITADDITLIKVSREFAEALEEDRDRDEGEARERRARRRAREELEDDERHPRGDRDEDRFDRS
jgi:hypothetical protein